MTNSTSTLASLKQFCIDNNIFVSGDKRKKASYIDAIATWELHTSESTQTPEATSQLNGQKSELACTIDPDRQLAKIKAMSVQQSEAYGPMQTECLLACPLPEASTERLNTASPTIVGLVMLVLPIVLLIIAVELIAKYAPRLIRWAKTETTGLVLALPIIISTKKANKYSWQL